ncbi:hypothetical protein [Microbacterium luticocti]|uniref:hypothetical protein n=1 Tax=Microbacterium luticocti TaxID=451764 RepID=UPI0004199BD9|nr:hypothetical protein [Microbacterium luticocti]
MFTLTDDTCVIVKAIAAQTDGGREHGGLRISDGADRGADYALEPAGGPQQGDVVVEQSGARVFLAADVAPLLGDTVLEATVNHEGVVDFSFGSSTPPQGMTEVRSTGEHRYTH